MPAARIRALIDRSNGEAPVEPAPVPVVAVDANGADRGPAEVAAGANIAAAQGVRILLFGPAAQLGSAGPGIEVIDAPQSIAKEPNPAAAARSNPESSIVRAARAVAAGDADALVSAGATGAALAAALFNIKRDRGILRPALAATIPVPGAPVTLVDVGANTEVRPEHLVQFAFMGAALAQVVHGIDRPRIALLSVGEEASRGSPLTIDVHARLAALAGLNFVGNIEGHALVEGKADIVVTDGFTGNVALKVMEGVSSKMIALLRQTATSSTRAKAGGLLMAPALRAFRDEIHPELAGGAYLLGLRKLGVVGHGRFTSRGFAHAILLAARGVTGDVPGRTHDALERAGALRKSGGALSETANTVSAQ
ncbi:MAG: Phosphate:acyl-ACP acyltransferase PlsX (EC [uncultured Solirubrobacteraceae bacterium]|uniref:Phosphate acyltransferase n=1 Tax=uncultured Solirubrobacteraceae bacterium TaxID=1162706 RepID=A0A6J4SQ17_9ACTN|nr:MAG: Phosphate:acyl-ACP acyltransferase PlsX (EC [uncultured Solirubrobacteraceae bacterium]